DTTESDTSSISANTESTQDLSENTVSLTSSAQTQNSQTDTVDASKTTLTQNQNLTNTSQEQVSKVSNEGNITSETAQSQAQSLNVSLVAVTPKAAETVPQNGWQTEDGNSYYYKDGQKLTGQQNIDGKDYYFNDQGQQQKDYFLNQNNHTYYFRADGTRLNDGFYTNWGRTYYFQADGSRLDNNFYTNWGRTYYFQADGSRLDNNFYTNWGRTYYFQADGSRLDNNFYTNWGRTYYFGDDGARWDNRFYSNWGRMYYFGSDGARWDNRFMNAFGNVYYFGNDGSRATNTTINLGYGDLTFDDQGRLSSNNAFIGSIVNGAIQGWTQHQILPSLTLAQAILESAWGKSTLASTYHNLFGIKGSYNGMSVNMPTYEEYGGRMVLINDAFRRYPDNNASVQDHTDFLIKNSRYHNLIGVRDANTATYLIRADGYATASTYTSSLRNVINTYDLTRYDRVAFSL
ncbi:glucosaminidase domain-containing protein, partial [Limosilactobacillus reuteri]|uniref:glucosaminidase domain-containing protein n=1 Tax=Limosilactobacillus reuteri TaxID=1598 RepID=UPI001E29E142